MKNYLIFTSLFLLFFACKKDNTNTPAVVWKELEVSGMVIDFETGKPLEGVDLIISRSINIREPDNDPNIYRIATVTNLEGKYNFKFTAKDSVTYWLTPDKKYYLEFNGFYSCTSCGHNITPFYFFNHGSNQYNLTDTFYMAKAGKVNLNFNLGKTPVNDTLFIKNHQFYNNKKIGGDYPSYSNYKNYTPSTDNFKTLADRMTYLTWKLKSESVWHQDSITTPFGKTVDFEIKY
jgi:hypothetical protein